MDYEIGVLLYHCTQYGRVDFDIKGSVEGILNVLSSKLDIEAVKDGFTSEGGNYIDCQEMNIKDFDKMFVDSWNEVAPPEHQLHVPVVVFGCETIGATKIYYVQIEDGDFHEMIDENIQTRNEAMLLAAQKAIELDIEVEEWH